MATSTPKKKATASPVAAREQLDQRQREDHVEDTLEEQAKAQEAQQKEELKTSHDADSGLKQDLVDEGNVAGARRPNAERGPGAVNGFTDQLTRRDGAEPMEGHFVTIDKNADGVLEAYKSAGLTGDDDEIVPHAGDYGVYRTVGAINPENGYPETIVVRLQDATFTDVTVPYEACRHSASRGI
jgi:hypothetical protein